MGKLKPRAKQGVTILSHIGRFFGDPQITGRFGACMGFFRRAGCPGSTAGETPRAARRYAAQTHTNAGGDSSVSPSQKNHRPFHWWAL